MLDLTNTVANMAAAAAVNARIEADAAVTRARARMLSLIGAGGLLALAGVGIGAGIAGYNTRVDMVNGTVKLDPDSAVVRLDASTLPHAPAEAPASGAKVVTDYAIFQEVAFPGGRVETMWKYDSSEDPAPVLQYCRFVRTNSGGSFLVTEIAIDGVPLQMAEPVEFDLQAALKNCVWFRTNPRDHT